MPSVSAARKTAFRILLAVERGPDHADDLLREQAVSVLASPDRNLTTALVMGVLRWQIWLDAQFRPLCKRPNAKLDPEVLIALRLALFQLRFLDRIPAHAAIDESVELTKHSGHRFAAGMVNAVLRSLARGDAARAGRWDERAAEAQAHPAWLVERWTGLYGVPAMQAICHHGQSQPRTAVRIEDARDEEYLLQTGIELAPGKLLTAARTVVAGDVTAAPGFREGRLRIQDEGSQLIAELAAHLATALVRDEKKILDACAAPGGKTLILAERLPQARIVACEASPRRLAELRQRLASWNDRVECRIADAAELNQDAAFDFALADVPCSGTGTLGRNPEIRHRLRAEDFPRIAERQRAILGGVLRAVRPGGRVVYSTCSIEPEENEEILAAVLAENPNFRKISILPALQALEDEGILQPGVAERLRGCVTPEGALRLLPGAVPSDGFFVAPMERLG